MGQVRPGDMGFDVIHLNLHKTFSTPHGGGGPGSGAVGCKDILKPYLPSSFLGKDDRPEHSVGQVRSFYGNFGVVVRALTYMLTLGAEGMREASQTAVLNANYLMHLLGCVPGSLRPYLHARVCLTLADIKKETGISALMLPKAFWFWHAPANHAFPADCTGSADGAYRNGSRQSSLMRRKNISWLKKRFILRLMNCAMRRLTYIGRPDEVKAAQSHSPL